MKFILDAEQRLFGETVDKLLAEAGTPEVIRSWAAGEHAPGLALWRSLAEAGIFALAVPEEHDGAGLLPVELVTAFHELGRHAAPGPYVETAVAAVLLDRLGDEGLAARWLPGIAAGEVVASVALPPAVPYVLDADIADVVMAVGSGPDQGVRIGSMAGPASAAPEAAAEAAAEAASEAAPEAASEAAPEAAPEAAAEAGPVRASLDPARRLFALNTEEVAVHGSPGDQASFDAAVTAAYDMGVLLCAAQLIGLGRRLLEITVAYATTRQQFGRPIGEFQAVKHQLSNALVGLEYARPLVHGAALALDTPDFTRDVSAAKVAASEAAYATAKIALQLHGAIGYTDEYDPSLWIRKVRALHSAWGSPSAHRARVLTALR